MILDYLIYRFYKAYCKYKKEGDPFTRSKGCLLATLQIIIIPVGINTAFWYHPDPSIFNIIPYALINLCMYMYIRKRYTRNRLKGIVAKYDMSIQHQFPMWIIWIFVAFSTFFGLVLAALVSYYIVRPLSDWIN
uniref:hypothetical protein n=1 Tax=Prevotella sp. TaxID=59823 RepID=UPI003FED9FBF